MMCECLDRGDGTAHVDECCYSAWKRFQAEEVVAEGTVYRCDYDNPASVRALAVLNGLNCWLELPRGVPKLTGQRVRVTLVRDKLDPVVDPQSGAYHDE